MLTNNIFVHLHYAFLGAQCALLWMRTMHFWVRIAHPDEGLGGGGIDGTFLKNYWSSMPKRCQFVILTIKTRLMNIYLFIYILTIKTRLLYIYIYIYM